MKSYKYCPICGGSLKIGNVDGKKRRYCPLCNFINYINPLPTVGIIGLKKKRILLVKRKFEPAKGIWSLPSGFIESGESPQRAALRELEEETGVSGKLEKLVGVYKQESDLYGDIIVIVYLVRLNDRKLISGDDAEEVKYFDIETLPDLHFTCFKEAIKDLRKMNSLEI